MLPKTNRADKKTVDRIFASGRFLNSPTFTFKYILGQNGAPRISFIVPKHAAKLATKRNALRRKGYTGLKKVFTDVPRGLAGVFIFKTPENDTEKINKDIRTILGKISS